MGISDNFENNFRFPLWIPIVFIVVVLTGLLLWQYGRDDKTPKSTFDIPGLKRATTRNDMSKAEELKKFCETYKSSKTHTAEETSLYEQLSNCEPVNCYGEWGEWSEPEGETCEISERTYKIKKTGNPLGDKCPFEDGKTEKKVVNADKCDYSIFQYAKASEDSSNIVLEYVTDSVEECSANCTANFDKCQFITLTKGNVCQFHVPKEGVEAYSLEYDSNVTTYSPPYNKNKFIEPSYPSEVIQTIEDIQKLPKPSDDDIESKEFLKIEGVNVFEGDVIDQEINIDNVSQCETKCLSSPKCTMYTHDKEEKKCLLKSVVDERVTAFKDPDTDTYKLVIKLK